MEKFRALGLSNRTIHAIENKGFEEPTDIQALTIPLLLKNETDIIAQAQTGTGKTAAFALPLIERLDPGVLGVQALIMAPTRELVIQICEEMNSLKGDNRLSIAPIYGGQSIELQLRKLRKGVSIVVGTPGRLLDHIKRKSLFLDDIEYFVLDEADEMLNMGFIEDIESILSKTPENKRVLLFSATMPNQIKKLAENYMGSYEHVKSEKSLTTDLTQQIYFEVAFKDKFEALCRIVDMESDFYGLVFCRTRLDVDEVVNHLIERGYAADGMHGDITQAQRERTLSKFRKNQISILVATDVAARGIDVDNLTHVINYSIPHNPEAYIHRIGRTGRAGREGTAITFITPSEFRKLGFIKRITNAEIRKESVPEVHEIIKAKRDKISDEIEGLLDSNDIEGYKKWAKRLLGDESPIDVLAGVLKHAFGKSLDGKNYQKLTPVDRKGRKTKDNDKGKTRLFIAKGKDTIGTKKKLISYIEKVSGIDKDLMEDVEIYDAFSFVTLPFVEAETLLNKFIKGRNGKPLIEKVHNKKSSGKPRRKNFKRNR